MPFDFLSSVQPPNVLEVPRKHDDRQGKVRAKPSVYSPFANSNSSGELERIVPNGQLGGGMLAGTWHALSVNVSVSLRTDIPRLIVF